MNLVYGAINGGKRQLGGFLGATLLLMAASQVHAQQASLVLSGSDAVLCNHNTTDWTLTKTSNVGNGPVESGSVVTWTVNATRGATSNNILEVNGFVKISNSGTKPATIGNIVVNLQKKVGNKWVSAAANVANAFSGDAATSAKIVADASQEVAPNGINYTKAGGVGTFTETAGSGGLSFSDVNSNTIWSINPSQTIPGNGTVDLIFEAEFNNTALSLPAGSQVRAEIIVTFGNAGARGGSGSTLANVDINGDGSLSADEANVRSVPTRITRDIPALEKCNDSVTVTDAYPADVTTTGTVTTSVPTGFDINTQTSSSISSLVGVTADGGVDGGYVYNTAHLTSPSSTVSVVIGQQQVGTDPVTGLPVYQPIYYTFLCCEGLDLSATSGVQVKGELPPDGDPFDPGDYLTYSQGGYGGNGAPFNLLSNNFAAAFPSGVEVGIPGAGGFSMKFTSAAAVKAYLPAGGPASSLTADLNNPTSSGAGVFGGQVLALKLSVGLSDAAVTPVSFGDVYLNDPTSSLHGKTIRQILAVMEIALGGGGLPAGYTFGSLNALAEDLNLSFHPDTLGNPAVSAWAMLHLSKTPPAP